MSGKRFTVIADDLTGAADTGLQLARSGYRTAVFFQGEPVDGAGLDAVVVDTDSRSLTPDSARERVFEAVRAIGATDLVFKKVDSALRGNLHDELEAAMDASDRQRAVVAPAFPGGGRATVNGTQLLYGEPICLTEFSTDPRTPVKEDHIPTLLAGLGPLKRLGVDELRDPRQVGKALENYRCLVADATEDAHLRSLVEAVDDPSEVLWVGSAGLALALGSVYPGTSVPALESEFQARNALVVVGSLNQTSRQQLHALVDKGTMEVELRGSPEDSRAPDVHSAIAEVERILEQGESVALCSSAKPGNMESGSLSEGLAGVVAGLEAGAFDALVLTGGDTAVAVSRTLGATGIELLGEVESGVPVGRLVGPRPYPVVTKAGGFGKRDTLCKALKTLIEYSEEK